MFSPTRPPSNANSLQDREEGHVDVRLVLVHGDEEDGREEQGVQDPPRPAETRGAARAAARHGISFYWTTTARFCCAASLFAAKGFFFPRLLRRGGRRGRGSGGRDRIHLSLCLPVLLPRLPARTEMRIKCASQNKKKDLFFKKCISEYFYVM